MKDLREYVGKKLVSFLRKGDFAHAGEQQAIDLVLEDCDIKPKHLVLDVGCGLGGTAAYIQQLYNCTMYGLDIEKEAIEFAKKKYPNCHFYTADVAKADIAMHPIEFDFILAFNAFYAFPNQQVALSSLAKIAHPNTVLTLFDYSDLTHNKKDNPLYCSGRGIQSPFLPINPDNIEDILEETGWKLEQLIDISDNYLQWYSELLEKLHCNKQYIIEEYGEAVYIKADKTYTSIYSSLKEKTSGGISVYAKKCQVSNN